MFPWLKYFPIYAVRFIKKYARGMEAFLCTRYDEHSRSLDPTNPKDFLSWLIMVSKDEKMLKRYGLKELTRDSIESISINMFLGALDATIAILLWTILHFLHYPKYVDEVLNEIRSVVGVSKYPEIKDRSSLPKVQAFSKCV